MTKECPTCGSEMVDHGYSGDVRTRRGIQGLDISWWECPECETVVDDLGSVQTKRERVHQKALAEKALREASRG